MLHDCVPKFTNGCSVEIRNAHKNLVSTSWQLQFCTKIQICYEEFFQLMILVTNVKFTPHQSRIISQE
jgi:hypothetical protein